MAKRPSDAPRISLASSPEDLSTGSALMIERIEELAYPGVIQAG